MAFEQETKDVILSRMLAQVDASIDKRQGSVTHDLLSPSAIELAQAYIALDQVLTFGFSSENTPTEFIAKRAADFGVYQKPAVASYGRVTFTGADGVEILMGTRVSTDDVEPIYFVLTEGGIITGGSITVDAEAEVAGANGNVAPGKITIALGGVSGVTSVTNTLAFDGGADLESGESLLARLREKVERPATSGNAFHYEQWAKSVAGVGGAKVYPLAFGNGTVKVVLIDEDKTAPPAATVTAAASYIESVRPIGATVTVVGATETTISVTATLTLASGKTLAEAQTEFTTLLRDYLKTLAFVDSTVRYSKIASLMLNTKSIVDYTNLKVNTATANVVIADGAVAVVGTVTFT